MAEEPRENEEQENQNPSEWSLTITQQVTEDGEVRTNVEGPMDHLLKLNILHDGHRVVLEAMTRERMEARQQAKDEASRIIIPDQPGLN